MGSFGNCVLARYYARELKLLTDLHSLSQGDLTVQDFYFKLTIIWDELALMEPPKLQNVASYIALRDRRRLTRFLLRLRKEFDSIRSSLLHKSPLPMVEAALNEVLAEAIHIKSTSDYLSFSVSSPAVATVKDGSIPMPNRSTTRVTIDECSYCLEKGHRKKDFPMRCQGGGRGCGRGNGSGSTFQYQNLTFPLPKGPGGQGLSAVSN